MKLSVVLTAVALTLGFEGAYAQSPPSYSNADLIVTFEDAAGNDVEFNLGLVTRLPASGTEDFGSVSAFLTGANGGTLGTTLWSAAAALGGGLTGAGTTISTSSGPVTALPNAVWLTQDNGATPSFAGSASADSTPVNTAIAAVGTDISTQAGTVGTSGIGLLGVVVSASGDPNSFTSQDSYANVSTSLETTGPGSAALWLLTSTTPGTAGKSGTKEGPFNGAYELGTISLSGNGELTFTGASDQGGTTQGTAAARVMNVSSRTFVGAGADAEVTGFVVSGPPGSTEQLLVRGVGPALSQFGVSGALAQPVLTLFDSAGNQLATNTGWSTASNASDIATAITAAGAFPLSSGSADSAILVSLAPGAYTAQITGLGGSTGVALAEVYQAASGNAELTHIAARAMVGAGANVVIGGIVVGGSEPMSVLIRAVGPTLSQFGVSGALAQPSLLILDSSGSVVASNAGWSSNADPAAIAAESGKIGAFALPSGSGDCALMLTLTPGAYTAIISGQNGTAGVALAEVYPAP